MAVARSAYRNLARAIRKDVGPQNSPQWLKYAKSEFLKPLSGTERDELERRLALANDYAFLVISVREQKVQESSPHAPHGPYTCIFGLHAKA